MKIPTNPDYASILNIPKGWKKVKALNKSGKLIAYKAENPLPAMWLPDNPCLRHSPIETRNDSQLMALGVAIYKAGHGQLEAFFHFKEGAVMWLGHFDTIRICS